MPSYLSEQIVIIHSKNSYEKSKEGGRGTKIWGSKGSVFVNRVGYQIYNLKDELCFPGSTISI